MSEQDVPARVTLQQLVIRKWPKGSDPERDPPAEVVETTFDPVDGRLMWVTERIYRHGRVASVRRYLATMGG
jgi:hypothetical protein